jgi:hypothetical protein
MRPACRNNQETHIYIVECMAKKAFSVRFASLLLVVIYVIAYRCGSSAGRCRTAFIAKGKSLFEQKECLVYNKSDRRNALMADSCAFGNQPRTPLSFHCTGIGRCSPPVF